MVVVAAVVVVAVVVAAVVVVAIGPEPLDTDSPDEGCLSCFSAV